MNDIVEWLFCKVSSGDIFLCLKSNSVYFFYLYLFKEVPIDVLISLIGEMGFCKTREDLKVCIGLIVVIGLGIIKEGTGDR